MRAFFLNTDSHTADLYIINFYIMFYIFSNESFLQ